MAIRISRKSGFGRGKSAEFANSPVTLGTVDTCDMRFDPTWDKTVAPRHAQIEWDGQDWILRDLQSPGGIFVKGMRLSRPQKLTEGLELELGKGGPRIVVEAVGAPESATGVGRPVAAAHSGAPLPPPPPAPEHALAPTQGGNQGTNFAAIGVVAAILALIAGAVFHFGNQKTDSPVKNAPSEQAWQIQVDMGGELFPSYLVACATMKTGSVIHVEFDENEVMRRTVFEEKVPSGISGSVVVYPTINYRYDALRGIKQSTPVTITASVTVDGASAGRQTLAVRAASINDCPLSIAVPGKKGAYVSTDWLFGAYVNENHPISDEIRREALKSGIIPAFLGYQGGKNAVYLQVFAIWNVLQKRGMRYSNITTTPGVSDQVLSQYVRFIDQSINNSQANCVDGSVLFASILRQIGIEPVLVHVPGHMFMGFFVDPEGKELEFLETTMIGAVQGQTEPASQKVNNAATVNGTVSSINFICSVLEPTQTADVGSKKSLESFEKAILTAREEVKKNFKGAAGSRATQRLSSFSSKTVSQEEANVGILPIIKARELGIMPIGYQP